MSEIDSIPENERTKKIRAIESGLVGTVDAHILTDLKTSRVQLKTETVDVAINSIVAMLPDTVSETVAVVSSAACSVVAGSFIVAAAVRRACLDGKTTVIIPLLEAKHYTLMVVTVDAGKVVRMSYYDSVGGSDVPQRCRLAIGKLERGPEALVASTLTWDTLHGTVQARGDGFTCGLHVIMKIARLFVPSTETTLDVTFARHFVLACLETTGVLKIEPAPELLPINLSPAVIAAAQEHKVGLGMLNNWFGTTSKRFCVAHNHDGFRPKSDDCCQNKTVVYKEGLKRFTETMDSTIVEKLVNCENENVNVVMALFEHEAKNAKAQHGDSTKCWGCGVELNGHQFVSNANLINPMCLHGRVYSLLYAKQYHDVWLHFKQKQISLTKEFKHLVPDADGERDDDTDVVPEFPLTPREFDENIEGVYENALSQYKPHIITYAEHSVVRGLLNVTTNACAGCHRPVVLASHNTDVPHTYTVVAARACALLCYTMRTEKVMESLLICRTGSSAPAACDVCCVEEAGLVNNEHAATCVWYSMGLDVVDQLLHLLPLFSLLETGVKKRSHRQLFAADDASDTDDDVPASKVQRRDEQQLQERVAVLEERIVALEQQNDEMRGMMKAFMESTVASAQQALATMAPPRTGGARAPRRGRHATRT